MRNTPKLLCSEEQMLLIQKITNAPRQEVMHTILISRISVEEIILSLKKSALKMLPLPAGHDAALTTGRQLMRCESGISLYLPKH